MFLSYQYINNIVNKQERYIPPDRIFYNHHQRVQDAPIRKKWRCNIYLLFTPLIFNINLAV